MCPSKKTWRSRGKSPAPSRVLDQTQKDNRGKDDQRTRIRKTLIESDQSDPNGFERIIGESDLLSINFLHRGQRAAAAVCRIRVPGDGGGWMATGFLVGPRLLMTNNHVLSSAAEAAQAECEFEYEHDVDGVMRPAVQFNLAPNEVFFTDMELDVTLVAVVPFSDGGVPIDRYGHLPLISVSGKFRQRRVGNDHPAPERAGQADRHPVEPHRRA